TSVISIERVLQLHRRARDLLYDLGVRNVKFRHGDGFSGSVDQAPYDGILAAAVSDDVPTELIDQLAEGGRIVMPVNQANEQRLIVIDKHDGAIKKQTLDTVRFVPRLSGVQ
ncbi:MAG: protein-L-isoaspartate O-methyltransferase, partial [Pseudomonadota bacterium]